jgi:hypothetical protein
MGSSASGAIVAWKVDDTAFMSIERAYNADFKHPQTNCDNPRLGEPVLEQIKLTCCHAQPPRKLPFS